MAKKLELSPGLRRLLEALIKYDQQGGVFDRWVRIVVAGEVVTFAGSTVPLTAFRYGFIQMRSDGRVELTLKGLAFLQEHGGG